MKHKYGLQSKSIENRVGAESRNYRVVSVKTENKERKQDYMYTLERFNHIMFKVT